MAGRPPWPSPVNGEQAKAASQVDVGGRKRQALLVLIASYQDAGFHDPPLRLLAVQLGFKWHFVDMLVSRLEQDGHIAVERRRGRRNVYTLTMEGRPEPQAEQAA